MKLPLWICHQKPERCFKINNKPMLLCSRCFGLYFFIFIGFLFSIIIGPESFNIKQLIIFTIIITSPFFFDSITQFLGFRNSNNTLRFITGSFAGLILGIDLHFILVYFI